MPLADLTDPANRYLLRHPTGFLGPAFCVAGMEVWGFTAGLLDAILEASGLARPWDTDDVRPLPESAIRPLHTPGLRRRRRGRRRRADGRGPRARRPSAAYGSRAMTQRTSVAPRRRRGGAPRWSAGRLRRRHPGHASPRRHRRRVGTVTVAPDGVQEITLQTQDDYVFTPDHFTVTPGKVRLTVTNVAKQPTHNFDFTPDKGPAQIDAVDPAAGTRREEDHRLRRQTAGDYPFQCSFHVQLGQVGTMTVKG